MKKLIFIIILIIIGLHMYANPIDSVQAKFLAKDFFSKKCMPARIVESVLTNCKRRTQAKEYSPYYIFNTEKGFVIISGNDNTRSVLGYSLKGLFNEDSIPDNMQALLDFYEYQINYIESHNISSTNKTSYVREPIAPLLTCKWAQNNPYNLKCPTYKGQKCVTGCLATALSQVMYYYKWPQKTTQEIPGYNININGISTDIPSIPSGTQFEWDKMLPEYNKNTTDSASMYAVATLMSAVGTALHMGYNTGTSEAFFSYYDEVPKKYFGYHKNQKLIYRSDIENWEETIYNELANKRPVVYGGQSGNGGHAFVVDGYDGDQLFHVDWGYGVYEGYYLLDVMNGNDYSGVDADYDRDGYSKSQCAIINLVPSGWTANTEYTTNDNEQLESKGIKISGSLQSGQTQEILIDLINKGAGLYGTLALYGEAPLSPQQEYITTIGFTLKRRATRTACIPWTPEKAGEYKLFVKIKNKILDSLTVSISKGNTPTNTTGLRLVSIHMDGENIESKSIDPTDSQSTLVDVIGNNQTANIAIINAGSSRWDGVFRFDVCVFDEKSNTYKLYRQMSGSGWGTPGYTWNYELYYSNLPCGKYCFKIYANDILIDNNWHFNIVDGVPAWTGPKGGKMLVIRNNQLEIPDNILAVDLTAFNNLDIIPNNNPNTIYIINTPNVPPNINNRNVLIKQNKDSYIGNSINLHEGYSYYSPYSYTAKSIKYTKKFSNSSVPNSTKWETFCLPFTASKSVSNNLKYKWCTSVNDKKGNYLLEKLSQFVGDTAYYVCEDDTSIIAWRPYVISVPRNLKEMIFSAENIVISSSSTAMPRTKDYTFASNFIQRESYDIYCFESNNNRFKWCAEKQLSPFNSYLLSNNDNYSPDIINIQTEYVDIVEPTALDVITYTFSITSTGNGLVSYNGTTIRSKTSSFTVNEGASATISFTPDKGYQIKNVKVNNSAVSVSNNQYTVKNITSNTTVSVEFEVIPPKTYTLSITASGNGSATYNSTTIRSKTSSFTVNEGTSVVISFSPDSGNRIKSVKVNNAAVTVTNNLYMIYTIKEITSNTTVSVEFESTAPSTYTLSITASGNGSVSYSGTTVRSKTSSFTVKAGASATISFTPDKGCRIKAVKVNNTAIAVSNNQYTINNINANTAVSVEFEAITYTLSITALGNGSASYDGTTIRNKTNSFAINEGASATITFSPDNGCHIKSLKVNGASAAVSNNRFKVNSINRNTTVEVEFENNPPSVYKLTYMVDDEVYKVYEVEEGATITPEPDPIREGYKFSGWSWIPSKMPSEDVVITGYFIQIAYIKDHITYETDGKDASVTHADNVVGEIKIEASVVINGQTYQVTSIAEEAFQGCTGLTSVEIPNTITKIGKDAFSYCFGLQIIMIGKGIKEIGSKAFAYIARDAARTRSDNTGLKVYCEAEVLPSTAADAFDNSPIGGGTLIVNDELVGVYKVVMPWNGFGSIVGLSTGIDSVTIDAEKPYIYDIRGNRIENIRKGVNIILTKDGKSQKVMKK